LKSERCTLDKTETSEISIQNTETLQGNSCNSDVFHDSDNQGAGSWAQANYHRRTFGKGHISNYNRSLERRNDWRESGYSYRSVSPKSNDQIFLNSKDNLVNNEGQNNCSECDNKVDRQSSKSSEAVNIESLSQDCIVGTQKKDTEVALNGAEGVRPSESTVFRRKLSSQSLQSTANGGRIYNAPCRPRMSIVQLLREYDKTRQRMEFYRNFYTCKICFQVTSLLVCKFQVQWAGFLHHCTPSFMMEMKWN
jgi:hypothetical protein